MSERPPLVLVVEDDPAVRGLISSVMTANGYEVITANDGLEGLVRIELRRPSLVVMDVMMPNVEGGRMLEEIRADARIAGVPVIVVSGKPDAHAEFDALVGRANVFTKPFDPDALVARADALLGHGGPA